MPELVVRLKDSDHARAGDFELRIFGVALVDHALHGFHHPFFGDDFTGLVADVHSLFFSDPGEPQPRITHDRG